MVTKIEKMKAAMFACGVDEEIVNQAVANAEQKKAAPAATKKHSRALAAFAPGDEAIVTAFEERFWKAYPKRSGPAGKAEARTKFTALVKAGANMEKIIDAAAKLKADWAPRLERKPSEACFIPMAVTWLNKGRFNDDPDDSAPVGGPGGGNGGDSMLDLAIKHGAI